MSANQSTSEFRGVYWDWEKSLWRAEIQVRRRRFKLGRFNSPEKAAAAYDAMAEYLGVPERCNTPKRSVFSVRECAYCRGLGLVGGEFKKKTRRIGTYIAALGNWRNCTRCLGRGYFLHRESAEQKPCCICSILTRSLWTRGDDEFAACSMEHVLNATRL